MIEFFSKKLNYDFLGKKYATDVGRDYVSGAMEIYIVIHEESATKKSI